MTIRFPFTLIAGEGLGTCYSSYTQLGSLVPNRGFGQGDLQFYFNASNGNVVIEDHKVSLVDPMGTIDIGFIYNSYVDYNKPSAGWNFNLHKRLSAPPPDPGNPSPSLTLIEADGHQTIYKQILPGAAQYRAPGHANGTRYICYDDIAKAWQWCDPGTGVREHFDNKGRISDRNNRAGIGIRFEYDNQDRVTAIQATTTRYEIRWNSNASATNVQIISVDSTGAQTLLQDYKFDNLGRLITTKIPPSDGNLDSPNTYTITYTYINNSPLICNAIQSDNTNFYLNYQRLGENNFNFYSVSNILPGYSNAQYKVNYDIANAITTITTGIASQVQIKLDDQQRISQLVEYTGYDVGNQWDTPGEEITTYNYADNGQIKTIIYPDSSQETFLFTDALDESDPDCTYAAYGLLRQHVESNKQTTDFYHGSGADSLPWVASRVQSADGVTPLATRYVYDSNYDNLGMGNTTLRFEISPEGSIREYQTQQGYYGKPAKIRNYLSGTYDDIAHWPPPAAPSLADISAWAAQQKSQYPQQATLTRFEYDTYGQVLHRYGYANLDEKGGEGIEDAQMSFEETLWDRYGGWNDRRVRQQTTADEKPIETYSESKQEYDNLHRLIVHKDFTAQDTDANALITSTAYLDEKSQILVTRPNGRQELKTLSTSGEVTNEQVAAGSQARTTAYQYDQDNRPSIITQSDGQIVYVFYDCQQRLGFRISPTGIVTEYRYDRIHRFNTVLRYNLPIDMDQFNQLPEMAELQLLLVPDAANDRITYQFFDGSKRLCYEVDAKQFVTEYQYDNLNRKVAKIIYGDVLTAAELAELTQGNALGRTADPSTDRITRTIYDGDNHIIATMDPAGYVTEFVRDWGGRVSQKIVYDNPTTNRSATTLDDLRPVADPAKDAYTYYYRDARGQCIAEVDPENGLTTRTFMACGLLQQKTKYANPVTDPNWMQNKTNPPVPPTASPEDRTTIPQYDLLNRVIKTQTSDLKSATDTFDKMGHVTCHQTYDFSDPDNIDPDHQRSIQTQYDGFEQITAQALPNVAQLLTAIEANNNLSREQKDAQELNVWQNYSARHTYDATGLHLYTSVRADTQSTTTDNITYFYYDNERRPIITIDPTGAITEKTLNTFGETISTRMYYTRMSTAAFAVLTGGFMTTAFRAQLNALQDNTKDHITQAAPDQRGLITEKIDAAKNTSTFAYNAFKECTIENLPVSGAQPSMTVTHVFCDMRGLETQTIKTATGETSMPTITRAFDNPFGKITSLTDERNGVYTTEYDRKARPNKKTDPLGAYQFGYDPLDRLTTETDPLLKIIQHQYNQTKRTHTTLFPVSNTLLVETSNVFDEKISASNSLSQTDTWSHAPDGKMAQYTDPLNNKTVDSFDLLGNRTQHTDANGIKTTYSYNKSSQLLQKIEDQGGRNYSTAYIPDAFGNNETLIDSMNVVRNQTFDPLNRITQLVIDPVNGEEGLNLVTANNYSGLMKLNTILGDEKVADQYYTAFQQDGFGREIGNVIDPITNERTNGLNIKTQKVLNAAGDVIKVVDPNNNVTWFFRDLKGNVRFKIDPIGGVHEWTYDAKGRLQTHRVYCNALNVSKITDTTTLIDIQNMAVKDPLDTLAYVFFNDNDKECFRVHVIGVPADEKDVPKGIVIEKRYDNAMRENLSIQYRTVIDATNISAMSTTDLLNLMANVAIPSQDRMTYYVRDSKGQERFAIKVVQNIISQSSTSLHETKSDAPSQQGVIIEKQYNAKGKVIMETEYANVMQNALAVSQMTPDAISQQLVRDPAQDRTNYTIYDSMDREWFKLAPGPNGDGQYTVVRMDYDANNNLLKTIEFAVQLAPSDYATMTAEVQGWIPNPAVDKITQKGYDNANRCIQITDALNNVDVFVPDALGNTLTHTDRNGAVWQYHYDRAKRCDLETAPAVQITQVQADANNRLTITAQPAVAVQKSKTFDAVGNIKTIIEACNTTNSRTDNFAYTARNQLQTETLANIAVDNPNLPASFSTRPEEMINLTKQTVYTHYTSRCEVG